MKPKVFVAQPLPKEVLEYLSEYCEYEIWAEKQPVLRSHLLKAVRDIEGLLIKGGKIDLELLQHAPNLKVVSSVSVGYNNFDLAALREKGVMGTNTAGALDETVADLVFGLILAVARRICELDSYVKAGKWQGSHENFGVDVHHKKLGIIGMGRIGEAISRRAKFGFGMEILYHNRNRRPGAEKTYEARYLSLDELLGQADFIVLMTPLNETTRKLIGRREFQLMQKSAVFINASRGETVDEEALIEALASKRVSGAGLDVFTQEPVDAENPLLKMANVVTLPHIGSATESCRLDMAMLAAKNLVAALRGEVPPNLIPELKNEI